MMLSLPADRFSIAESETAVSRRCPFCAMVIEDELGKDINFIVHLGGPTTDHQYSRAWADYVGYINQV